jgi:hypothetical protein
MTPPAFPGAIPAREYVERTRIAAGKHGIEPGPTLALVCVCRDELTVNVTKWVRSTWGPPFRVGSLGGMFLAGVGGLNAALSHVPNSDGRLRVVVYAMPHVGIGPDGTIGKILRPGQDAPTSACGALTGFRAELAAGRASADLDETDLEMSLLRRRLLDDLTPGQVPDVVELTMLAHDAIRADLARAAAALPAWQDADVAVFSGIQIHTAEGDLVAPGRSTVRPAGSAIEIPQEI